MVIAVPCANDLTALYSCHKLGQNIGNNKILEIKAMLEQRD
jgi:hypothetical protein